MTSRANIASLIETFVDDSASLTEHESETLLRALEADEALARGLKDSLISDQLLSEALGVGSDAFPEQTLQRLNEESEGENFESRVLSAVSHERKQAHGRPALFGAPLAAAAGIAAILAAWLMVGEWKGARGKPTSLKLRRPGGQVIARVEERIAECGLRNAEWGKRDLKVGDEVREGDWIEVGEKGKVALAYEVGARVELGEATIFGIEHRTSNIQHPTSKLERGKLTADVAKQSAIRIPQSAIRRRFTILTPHAVAVVKGTRFELTVNEKSSRIETLEGVVGFTSLADGKSVDVAAGRMASVGTDIPLTVKTIAAPAFPPPIGYTLGPIIFEDNFDKGLDNWELVIGKNLRSLEPAGAEAEDILTLKRDGFGKVFEKDLESRRNHGAVTLRFREEQAQGRIVCLRSKTPITEDAFSVKCLFSRGAARAIYMTPFPWATVLSEKEHTRRLGFPSEYAARWDCVPAGRGKDGAPLLETRFYLKDLKYGGSRKDQGLLTTRIVSCADRRIGIAFSNGGITIPRIEVRRLIKK